MGFNTVAMILNDKIDTLAKSPKSFTYAVCNAPMSMTAYDQFARLITDYSYNQREANPLANGLRVLPTYHADYLHFILAGHNSLTQTAIVSKDGSKRTVTLELPHWVPMDKIICR